MYAGSSALQLETVVHKLQALVIEANTPSLVNEQAIESILTFEIGAIFTFGDQQLNGLNSATATF